MFKPRDNATDSQPQFWVETKRLPKATASTFYRKLDETLSQIGFTEGVREICKPAYADAAKGGRPGIDPAVYFKMLMIGFFENLPSERSIASRCADSLSLRTFLGYQLDQDTPDHSSLSVIRTIIGDPYAAQLRKENQSPIIKQVLHKARRAVKSASGKALLRKRGEFIERSFAHVLDHGGLRRTTLRGKSNLTKRQLAAALAFDLSLLMRKLTGCGTPKQWLAGVRGAFFALRGRRMRVKSRLEVQYAAHWIDFRPNHSKPTLGQHADAWIVPRLGPGHFSTGC
ncbi:MAG: transposase [Luteolibacter sp.]